MSNLARFGGTRSGTRALDIGGSAGGFTLVELLVSMVVASVVLAGAYGLLVGQVETYRVHQDRADARLALRNAVNTLGWELRHVSPGEGDIYAMDSAAVTIRTTLASGVVCRKHPTAPRFGVSRLSGSWAGAGTDSVLIFGAGAAVSQDDAWRVMPLTTLATPTAFGVDPCSWSAAETPELAIEVAPALPADTASIRVGAPIRLFRTHTYETVQQGGQTWLARSATGGGGPSILAGPLTSSGLTFAFLDGSGAVTSDSSLVRSIQLTLRVERPDEGGVKVDSLVTRLTVRN